MPTVIHPAELVLDAAGIPYAPDYGDIYHSRAGGYAQAREVFLAGNELPQAWQGRRHFTILETGFGLGTNFLATWAAWRADPARCACLHFVSIERHPFRAADLAAWHGRDAQMAPLGRMLAAAWPVLTPGLHRLEFDGGAVVLILALGEAAAMLALLRLRADALYLDGFAPARNPDMWAAPVFEGLAQVAAPGATLATYTVARAVADGLTAAGFTVRKAPGFGGKRDMLLGRMAGEASSSVPGERHAMVIGAGIAGAAAADSLAMRGWRVTLIDGAEGIARGASSTPAGALHTILSRDDNRQSRFTRAAYLHMDRRLRALAGDWHAVCGRVDCLDDDGLETAAQLIEVLGLPPEYVTVIDAAAASERAGTKVARGGYWFERGAWLKAGDYCRAVLHGREHVTPRMACAVNELRRADDSWAAYAANGEEIARAPVVILANGFDLPRLAASAGADADFFALQRWRGQLTGIPAQAARAPRVLVSGEGYCLPAVDGMMWTGATYGQEDDASVRAADQRYNLERLARLLPDNDFGAPPDCAGHVGFRAVAPDRLPLVGAAPDGRAVAQGAAGLRGLPLERWPRLPGLYVSGGMASRGLTWAALAGEALACMIEGEPLPLETDLLDAVDPARFAARRLKRA